MGINKPFHRIYRPHITGSDSDNYIRHKNYANSPAHYVKAFLLIQKDLQTLFEFIEPCDTNKNCYSFRIHELLMRTCIEIEANFKAILIENNYKPKKDNEARLPKDWNIVDYWKTQHSHKLADYIVEVPLWKGENYTRQPYHAWKSSKYEPLKWYQAYNSAKHDRHNNFENASLDHLLEAICGLLVLISAQFCTYDPTDRQSLMCYGDSDNTIGGYFTVKFPNKDLWPENEKYDFNFADFANEDYIFAEYDYNK